MIEIDHVFQDFFNISDEDLKELKKQKSEKEITIGELLLQKNIISEIQYLTVLSFQYNISIWPKLVIENIDTSFTEKFPIQFLKKYNIVPLIKTSINMQKGRNTPNCIIAINNFSCFPILDDIVDILKLEDYKIVLSRKSEIKAAINKLYDMKFESAEQVAQEIEENVDDIIDKIEDSSDLLEDESDAPIIKLVNHIICQSIRERASDIHIEPQQDNLKIRYRIDGILYDLLSPSKKIQDAMISRIKVMANMNIAEKRIPQDGRFDVRMRDQIIDLRISTIPSVFGERVVIRLLGRTGQLIKLSDFDFEPETLDKFNHIIKSPNGIILVTGPTGSGKTTTLYAMISEINTDDINIITIEDPVEYKVTGISQIQVNPKAGLTFANGLRSIVRQDPDVILIGEIRDKETAEIAVQSALTGHLVFSTLHTNDAPSAITRMVDIGIDPFLISSSVVSVIAQRLVRILCNNCKIPYVPDELNLKRVGITNKDIEKEKQIYNLKGCDNCFQTGYKGRVGIYEIMEIESKLKRLICETYDSNEIKKMAIELNMKTLRQDGIKKILRGVTTINEVLRVTVM
ncbi:MAG: type II secretion system ATPase GspE [Desulfobacterales bacterium]|nr:type II secretion system ATPase GspE [Desulfobacterales bacterium]